MAIPFPAIQSGLIPTRTSSSGLSGMASTFTAVASSPG